MFDAGFFFDAGFGLQVPLALLAGIVSFLSPCVLPIVPPYLAFMTGTSLDQMTAEEAPARNRAIIPAIFFVLGLSTVFVLLGIGASAFGQAIIQYQDWFARIAGIIVMIFGLHFLGIIRIGLLYREARIDAGSGGGGLLGAYILGLAFAFGWTPCIGPILGMILSFVIQGDNMSGGIALMAVYAIGLGVPFVLAAIYINPFMRFMRRFRRHMETVERVMGLMLYTVGLMMLTGAFTRFSFWLLETFPALAAVG